jgi:hypothetical protein
MYWLLLFAITKRLNLFMQSMPEKGHCWRIKKAARGGFFYIKIKQ